MNDEIISLSRFEAPKEFVEDALAAGKDGINKSLLFSAAAGWDKTVSVLLEAGADVFYKDQYGNTALHWAAAKNHLGMIKELVSKGAPTCACNSNGRSPIFEAARSAQNDAVKILLNHDYPERDSDGFNLLMTAVLGKSKTCVRLIARETKTLSEKHPRTGETAYELATKHGWSHECGYEIAKEGLRREAEREALELAGISKELEVQKRPKGRL